MSQCNCRPVDYIKSDYVIITELYNTLYQPTTQIFDNKNDSHLEGNHRLIILQDETLLRTINRLLA